MRGKTSYPVTIAPQFLTEHGNFGFQLVDPGVLRVAVGDQCLSPREHRNAHDADDVQYCVTDGRAPALRTTQRLNTLPTDFVTYKEARKSSTRLHHRTGTTIDTMDPLFRSAVAVQMGVIVPTTPVSAGDPVSA
jgi:hypothetical protein